MEQKYLRALADMGSASIQTLAMCLGVDADHVERQIEPFLRHRGLVKVGTGGRQLTPEGQARMERQM